MLSFTVRERTCLSLNTRPADQSGTIAVAKRFHRYIAVRTPPFTRVISLSVERTSHSQLHPPFSLTVSLFSLFSL